MVCCWTESDSHDLLRNGKNVVKDMQIIETGSARVLEIRDDIGGSSVNLLGDAWLLGPVEKAEREDGGVF